MRQSDFYRLNLIHPEAMLAFKVEDAVKCSVSQAAGGIRFERNRQGFELLTERFDSKLR